jgi:hypothetical protein
MSRVCKNDVTVSDHGHGPIISLKPLNSGGNPEFRICSFLGVSVSNLLKTWNDGIICEVRLGNAESRLVQHFALRVICNESFGGGKRVLGELLKTETDPVTFAAKLHPLIVEEVCGLKKKSATNRLTLALSLDALLL